MLKVTDRFTSQDGEWFVSNKPYSITQKAIEKYSDIPGKGAAHHIFVKIPIGTDVVEFNTLDGKNTVISPLAKSDRWAIHPIFQGYNPEESQGAWLVRVDGEKVAEGIGLPYGLHVSTFLVVEDVEPVVIPDPPSVIQDKIQLVINGVTVWER